MRHVITILACLCLGTAALGGCGDGEPYCADINATGMGAPIWSPRCDAADVVCDRDARVTPRGCAPQCSADGAQVDCICFDGTPQHAARCGD